MLTCPGSLCSEETLYKVKDGFSRSGPKLAQDTLLHVAYIDYSEVTRGNILVVLVLLIYVISIKITLANLVGY